MRAMKFRLIAVVVVGGQRREAAADDNLPVRLCDHGIDAAVDVRVVARVERTGRIDAGNAIADHAADRGKGAHNHEPTVRLY
jgi:hypothetical protein